MQMCRLSEIKMASCDQNNQPPSRTRQPAINVYAANCETCKRYRISLFRNISCLSAYSELKKFFGEVFFFFSARVLCSYPRVLISRKVLAVSALLVGGEMWYDVEV